MTTFLILLWLLCLPGLLRAEKITLAYVAVNPGQGMLWVARDSGLLAKHGFAADVVLIPGSPRTTQALIAGDLDYAVAGAAAFLRARMQGADVVMLASLSRRACVPSSSKLTRRKHSLPLSSWTQVFLTS